MSTQLSLSGELTRCRETLQISQVRLARLMNLKTHRLADLEKGRSQASMAEANRLRRQMAILMRELQAHQNLQSSPLLADPRVANLLQLRAFRTDC